MQCARAGVPGRSGEEVGRGGDGFSRAWPVGQRSSTGQRGQAGLRKKQHF